MSTSIGGKYIGINHPPFIIAEMSGNHNQSLERALRIVDSAAEAGAHALKLQTYTPDTMTLDVKGGSFNIHDVDSLWTGQNLHDLYKKAYTPWEWHEAIFERAKQKGLICFSSPFDTTAVDFLEDLDVPAYKIASFENNHIPLITHAAKTGKPLIISTGMASVGEIDEAVKTARGAGCEQLILLKCTSTYPASPKNSNTLTIPHLKNLFKCETGLSDHTMGIGVAVGSITLGATVIEKHFTLSRDEGGVDSAFSLEPNELSNLVIESMRAWESLGEIKYGPTTAEQKSLIYRRSIYIAKDIEEGDLFSEDNIKIIRPGDGMHPREYSAILGRTSKKKLTKGRPLHLSDLM